MECPDSALTEKISRAVMMVREMASNAVSVDRFTSRIRRFRVTSLRMSPFMVSASVACRLLESRVWSVFVRCVSRTESVSAKGRESNRCRVMRIAQVS